jgi:hypothetical protein
MLLSELLSEAPIRIDVVEYTAPQPTAELPLAPKPVLPTVTVAE